MVAEDETLIRKKLVYFPNYEDMGMVVVKEVSDGLAGLNYIINNTPDIIICDINMPKMDGLEMLSKSLDYDYIAIIVSGYDYFDYAKRALKYGVSDYLLKPIDISELEESLRNAKKILEDKRKITLDMIIKDLQLNIGNNNIEDPVVSAMITYINDNYDEKISISDLTNTLMYSESMLNKKFKKEVGITFNEYLNRFRINKAIFYLKEKLYTVAEVSTMCGFSSPKYFSRVFKKYLGFSPTEI